jgi:SlyX protein
MEDRLIALEMRLAHFEILSEELSDVLMRQSQQIDKLTAQIARLQEKLGQMTWDASPQDDRPPPHY